MILQIACCDWCGEGLSWKAREVRCRYQIVIEKEEYKCEECDQTTTKEEKFNFCSFKCLRNFANNYETCKHEYVSNYQCERCGKFVVDKKEGQV